MRTQVPSVDGAGYANQVKTQQDWCRPQAPVEDTYGFSSVRQRFDPDLERTLLPHTVPLDAERILVYGDHLGVAEQRQAIGRHHPKVVAGGPADG